MRTMDDVERYLGLAGHPFEKVGETTWVVKLLPWEVPLVVHFEPPLVVFRLKVAPLPARNREEFMTTLLKLNANGLVHGAFGLEDGNVVLVDALEVENLDPNEFNATVDAFELALSQHKDTLTRFAG